MTKSPRVALALALALAASAAHAASVHCSTTATREVVCDDGSRAHRNAVGETVITRPSEKPVRCAQTATGEVCRPD